jgi:hypothetical protein
MIDPVNPSQPSPKFIQALARETGYSVGALSELAYGEGKSGASAYGELFAEAYERLPDEVKQAVRSLLFNRASGR